MGYFCQSETDQHILKVGDFAELEYEKAVVNPFNRYTPWPIFTVITEEIQNEISYNRLEV